MEKDDSVKVELFDIKGTPRRVILDSFLEAGAHTISYDFKDLPSGVYIVRISTSNTSVTQKMTLLK